MKVPLSWVREFVDADLDAEAVAHRLTMAGIEVESLTKVEGSQDVILEIAILANIARCQSVVGVAREVAALVGAPFVDRRSREQITASPGPLAPHIDAPEACGRFTLTLLDGVKVTDSPEWLQRRLSRAGVVPVNNVVDASNYVMLEMGQPTHAYALDRLEDPSLRLRVSSPGELVRPLGQAEPMVVPDGVPAVASASNLVALAGVIGSDDTRVKEGTSRVLVEAASFDMLAIRRSQARTKIHTEASARFSRGVDPTLPKPAVERMLSVLRLTCPELRVVHFAETVVPDRIDDTLHAIRLSVEEVNVALGTQLSAAQLLEPLDRLGFSCALAEEGQVLVVTVPTARRDVIEACDLIEEVARIRGYDQLPATMPTDPVPLHPYDAAHHARERARDALVEAGLQEVISYTLMSPEAIEAIARGSEGLPGPVLRLRNPVSVERSVVRRSLIPGLLQIFQRNRRHVRHLRLFEIGVVVTPELPSSAPPLPAEQTRAAILLGGLAHDETVHGPRPRPVDFFDLKAVVQRLLEGMHVDGVTIEAAVAAPFAAGATAVLRAGETTYGYMGLVHPEVAQAFDMAKESLFCAELDMDALVAAARRVVPYREIPRFPAIDIDIAVIAPRPLPAQQLIDVARTCGAPAVQRVMVFDVFESAHLGPDRKGVALRLTVADEARTLEMSEAQAVRERVVSALRDRLHVDVRE